MGEQIKVVTVPNMYVGNLEVGQICDISHKNDAGVAIDHGFFLFNDEFEWVESSNKINLSCNDKDCIDDEEKPKYLAQINEVSYVSVPLYDAQFVIQNYVVSHGYDITAVWYDDETKEFKAYVRKDMNL